VTDSEPHTPISYSSGYCSIWLSFRDMEMGQTDDGRQTNDSIALGVPPDIIGRPPDNVTKIKFRQPLWHHGQASEILRPHRPFRFRRGPQTGPQRWRRRPAERLETTSRSSSTNVAAYNRKRPETTEPGSVVCPAQSIIIVNCGVKSWKRQRSCRGTLHDDDDDCDIDLTSSKVPLVYSKTIGVIRSQLTCGR